MAIFAIAMCDLPHTHYMDKFISKTPTGIYGII